MTTDPSDTLSCTALRHSRVLDQAERFERGPALTLGAEREAEHHLDEVLDYSSATLKQRYEGQRR